MFGWKRTKDQNGSTKVVDPVCGMSMTPDRAIATRVVAGRTVYLCSPACIMKFDRDPARFVPDAPTASGRGGGHGSCC